MRSKSSARPALKTLPRMSADRAGPFSSCFERGDSSDQSRIEHRGHRRTHRGFIHPSVYPAVSSVFHKLILDRELNGTGLALIVIMKCCVKRLTNRRSLVKASRSGLRGRPLGSQTRRIDSGCAVSLQRELQIVTTGETTTHIATQDRGTGDWFAK